MKLIVDMDDVMSECTEQFQRWYRRDFGSTVEKHLLSNKKFSDAVPPEHRPTVLGYPNTKGFFRHMSVMPGSQQALRDLSKKYDVYIVTLATEFKFSLEEKHDWLESNFGFISWKKWVFCGDKSIVQGHIMIDDNIYNLDTFQGRKILFEAPHNIACEGYERVKNWPDITLLLLSSEVTNK